MRLNRVLFLEGKQTVLYPLICDRIEQASRIIRKMLEDWKLFNSNGFVGKQFDGSSVSLPGIGYEGAPRDLFWGGLFEPYIRDAIKECLTWIVSECERRPLPTDDYLPEMSTLLR